MNTDHSAPTAGRPKNLTPRVCLGSGLSLIGTLWAASNGGWSFNFGVFSILLFYAIAAQVILVVATSAFPMLRFRQQHGFRVAILGWVLLALAIVGIAAEVLGLLATPRIGRF